MPSKVAITTVGALISELSQYDHDAEVRLWNGEDFCSPECLKFVFVEEETDIDGSLLKSHLDIEIDPNLFHLC